MEMEIEIDGKSFIPLSEWIKRVAEEQGVEIDSEKAFISRNPGLFHFIDGTAYVLKGMRA